MYSALFHCVRSFSRRSYERSEVEFRYNNKTSEALTKRCFYKRALSYCAKIDKRSCKQQRKSQLKIRLSLIELNLNRKTKNRLKLNPRNICKVAKNRAVKNGLNLHKNRTNQTIPAVYASYRKANRQASSKNKKSARRRLYQINSLNLEHKKRYHAHG